MERSVVKNFEILSIPVTKMVSVIVHRWDLNGEGVLRGQLHRASENGPKSTLGHFHDVCVDCFPTSALGFTIKLCNRWLQKVKTFINKPTNVPFKYIPQCLLNSAYTYKRVL